MQRLTAMFAIAIAASIGAAPAFAEPTDGRLDELRIRENGTSNELANILDRTGTEVPFANTAQRGLDQQVARYGGYGGRGYGHGGYGHGRGKGYYGKGHGHYGKGYGHRVYYPRRPAYYPPYRPHVYRPAYRPVYRPYYAPGVYYSRPGFSIGIGF